ncbi:metalloregulator ArsR/SmtB family transcription factor [Nonomuraea sp. NPDC052116]|uniref:ArsR/SmtB family transcription factor n=1 Tax=Nonomuraea sp. NPDC052116 TaxID=3155665 RepID=UPI00341281D9
MNIPSGVDAERLEAIRCVLPSSTIAQDAGHLLALLADPGRIRLPAALTPAGELCVGDLAAAVGRNTSAVSHALRMLRGHRIVRARRTGRLAYYRLTDAHVRNLLQLAIAHVTHPPRSSADV